MTPIDNLQERLAKMETFFESAPETTDPFSLPDPGTYEARLREIDFFEAKATGAAFVKLCFDLTHLSKSVDIVHCLEPQVLNPSSTPEQVEAKYSYLKKDLITLGVDVAADDFTLASVRPGSAIWAPVLDAICILSVRESKKLDPTTGKAYRNLYLDTRVSSDVPTSMEPVAPPLPAGASVTAEAEVPWLCLSLRRVNAESAPSAVSGSGLAPSEPRRPAPQCARRRRSGARRRAPLVEGPRAVTTTCRWTTSAPTRPWLPRSAAGSSCPRAACSATSPVSLRTTTTTTHHWR